MLSMGAMVKGAKCEQLERVVIGNEEEKFFQGGARLPPWERQQLLDFLRKNIDVFVWSTYDTSGVDPNFICHHLNVNPSAISKK